MTRPQSPQPVRRFTGRHLAFIMLGFFGIVIAVNVFMARLAIGTFGGVVVENSYVASQHFNRWLDEAAAERALGWQAVTTRASDGHVSLVIAGLPAGSPTVAATARHPLGQAPDRALSFDRLPDSSFRSREALPAGRWRLRLDVRTAGKVWRTEGDIR